MRKYGKIIVLLVTLPVALGIQALMFGNPFAPDVPGVTRTPVVQVDDGWTQDAWNGWTPSERNSMCYAVNEYNSTFVSDLVEFGMTRPDASELKRYLERVCS